MKKRIAVVLLLMCLAYGCIKGTTPEGKTTYSVDPNKAAKVEKGVETGITVMQALTPFFPWLGAVATGVAGGLGVWKTQKPKFVKEQTRADLYHSVTAGLVTSVETLKIKNPAEYEKLKLILQDKLGPEAENAIRALRGLPPKV